MDLQFPLGGLSDGFAKSRQSKGTSPDAVNVRSRDPATGRIQGAVREGTTLVATLSAAVREIGSARYDGAPSTFALDSAPDVEWETETPQQAECRNLVIDVQGNVIALDGFAGVTMFNRAGELVWKFVLPVKDTDAICRALDVDDSGAFYVGVSAGGRQEESRLWKFRPRTDGSGDPIQEWEVVLGCYVEDVR